MIFPPVALSLPERAGQPPLLLIFQHLIGAKRGFYVFSIRQEGSEKQLFFEP
jgi:hypothetical protein